MKKAKWIILAIASLLAIVALWQINRVATQIRQSEVQKVRLWANAINQRNQLLLSTETFFNQVNLDERRKMRMYTNILESFNNPDMGSDLNFSLDYVHYIVDSCHTPIIIVDRDSSITVPQEMYGQRLTSELLSEFSQNPPFHYRLWGMPMTLYYKESESHTQLRQVLEDLSSSFLSEITNNTVFVPVLVVDSSRREIISLGNIASSTCDTPEKLSDKLKTMGDENDPIEIVLPQQDGSVKAFVYYESTPLLKSLRWVPIFYLFVALVLIIISYYLFRTAHTMEQNRIWVGLAKETAHQLGTPISSLIGWTDFLEGQTLTDEYSTEIRKDLNRLETITHRFSKIGSMPELNDSNVSESIEAAISYLQSRSPKKVRFVTTLPDEPLLAPHNSYLLQWVIENICKNAIDAMNGDGTFSIIASADARNIYIDLCDTGKGIPQSLQKKIFQSGFTTKQRGWGLGLSLAKRIIEQYHRGHLSLKYSLPGQGSVFHIALKKEK